MAACRLASPWPPSAAVGIDLPEHQPFSPYARSQASSAVLGKAFAWLGSRPPHATPQTSGKEESRRVTGIEWHVWRGGGRGGARSNYDQESLHRYALIASGSG